MSGTHSSASMQANHNLRPTIAFLICLALSGSALAQLRFHDVGRSAIESRLSSFAKRDRDREQQLRTLFLQAGCTTDRLSEQKVNGALPNLVCVAPGHSQATIIIGAHYDHSSKSYGVADNWSGASLLPSLLESLAGLELKHTFVFVAFSGEEEGLVGSHSYVDHMSAEERSLTQAMVDLDTLGLGPTEVWVSHSDPKLVNALANTANLMKLPASGMDIEQVGTTDSESFARVNIPSITVHSVTQSTLRVLHSYRDDLHVIKMDDYYDSYRLLAAYLAVLDAGLSAGSAPASGSH